VNESWRIIDAFPDYAVSSLGRVKRLTAKQGTWPGKILKARMNGKRSGNYYFVSLPDRDSDYHGKAVARLVALAFISNPDNKPEVNHKNGDKANNTVSNLEWATHKENGEHAGRTGLMPRGSLAGKAKLTEKDIPIIKRLRAKGKTLQSIGDKFGVGHVCIRDILTGRTWRHAGESLST
jgi:hypothetical protein